MTKQKFAICHLDRKHHAKGLCSNCYKRAQEQKNIKPSTCHPERRQFARGLCQFCYYIETRGKRQGPYQIIVYAYFDVDGTCLYVGRGKKSRLLNHKNKSVWFKSDSICLSMTCDSEWHAMEMEGRWGGRYLPNIILMVIA